VRKPFIVSYHIFVKWVEPRKGPHDFESVELFSFWKRIALQRKDFQVRASLQRLTNLILIREVVLMKSEHFQIGYLPHLLLSRQPCKVWPTKINRLQPSHLTHVYQYVSSYNRRVIRKIDDLQLWTPLWQPFEWSLQLIATQAENSDLRQLMASSHFQEQPAWLKLLFQCLNLSHLRLTLLHSFGFEI